MATGPPKTGKSTLCHPAARLHRLGVIALAIGENALSLFKILGVAAGPILAIASIQILRVNTRFLPPELRPSLWRRAGLIACALFYGTVSILLAIDFFRPICLRVDTVQEAEYRQQSSNLTNRCDDHRKSLMQSFSWIAFRACGR
ncbi:MAG: hypothetical protein R3C02_16275 [Planctomycetaceae bacterium]